MARFAGIASLALAASHSFAADVVEFYNAGLDNYFITADPNEAAAVDSGLAGPGWMRTGETFGSLGIAPVCRFYGSVNPGPNSHFYTASSAECNQLKQIQATTPATQQRWNFESLDFFTSLSTVDGLCPRNTVPVYRAYNNGAARGVDSNHRITSNAAAIQQVVARGWISEGVVMCASSAVYANQVAQANSQMKGIWTATAFSGVWPQLLKIDGNSFMDSTTITAPSGFEVGTWAYDPNDGRFYAAPTKDTNGVIGFSNRSATDLDQSIRIEGNDLVVRRADGSEVAHYQKLSSVQTSVLGGWSSGQPFASNNLFFFPDGHYLLIDVNGAAASCGAAGIEYGAYTWDPASGALTLPFVGVDTDGCSGFENGSTILSLTARLSADGNTLTITDANPAAGTPATTYTRQTP